FHRGHETAVAAGREIDVHNAGTPQLSLVLVAAAFFDSIEHVLERTRVLLDVRCGTESENAQRRKLVVFAQLDSAAVLSHRHFPLIELLPRHQALMRTEMQRWTKAQPQSAWTFEQSIDDVSRVLQMRHQHAFLDADSLGRKAPNRAAVLHRELLEDALLGKRDLASAVLVAAQAPAESIRTFEHFLEMIEHHRAAQRSGEGGDQEAVEAARAGAADCAGRVTAKGIRDQPFAGEELVAGIAALPAGLNRDRNRRFGGAHCS